MSAAQTWMDWLALKAGQCDLQLALVGGAVRDQLLGRRGPDKDLDLVVEGPKRWPAVELAQAVEQAPDLPSGFTLIHHQCFEAFGTAQLQLDTPEGPLLCDLSSARREHYAFPGAHPEVSLACLEEDLQRRDFSLNAIAQRLPAADHPRLDPFGGMGALKDRQLELLHPASLSDDPTRLIRGVRYGARLNLELSATAAKQAAAALQSWPWPQGAPALAARLRMELELLFDEPHWPAAIDLMQRWGALELLQREWQQLPPGSLAWLQRLGNWGKALAAEPPVACLRLLGLLLLAPSDSSGITAMASRLQLPQGQLKLLEHSLELGDWLKALTSVEDWQPSTWSEALESRGAASQPLLVLLQLGPGRCHWRRPLLRWLWRWRLIRSPIKAQELLAQGWCSGPALGEELRRRRAQAINLQP